ncbi:DUF488 family protein [Clostridium formicaceticum]|uniref:DUF488 domain-containing protein n=1 Tax=Clostridium formicaceticum TaxID=1497 RepID=A0AAC9RJV2_9CLOT|nr:DUF488 domain-containing protein [Clostridium formicaceticum]AOY77834.1 hypothetical protein BJL90_19395 [Clostridium formicaceticum]ARE88446.1 hypothetical protein CLFO_28490 [Clostridium formicaceticum]
MDIFTVGHSNYSIDRLLDMLNFYKINCVVDIRGTPYSKYNIQYNKETISQTLTSKGYVYIYMGKEFAAQREDKSLYTEEGYADFEKVIGDKDFLKGIERLKVGCSKGYRIALMGAKQDPISCHRCILLGRALREHGFTVNHILDDYTLASQEEMEERLLKKYYGNGKQITFDSYMEMDLSEEDLIRECYKKGNKEIGYRVERIKISFL